MYQQPLVRVVYRFLPDLLIAFPSHHRVDLRLSGIAASDKGLGLVRSTTCHRSARSVRSYIVPESLLWVAIRSRYSPGVAPGNTIRSDTVASARVRRVALMTAVPPRQSGPCASAARVFRPGRLALLLPLASAHYGAAAARLPLSLRVRFKWHRGLDLPQHFARVSAADSPDPLAVLRLS